MAEVTRPPHHRAPDETNYGLRQRLIEVAGRKATVTYSELSPTAPRAIGRKLDEINSVELAAGRPMLTAVVVTKETGKSSAGFFAQARAWGRFDGNNWDAFWQQELQAVWDHWGDPQLLQSRS